MSCATNLVRLDSDIMIAFTKASHFPNSMTLIELGKQSDTGSGLAPFTQDVKSLIMPIFCTSNRALVVHERGSDIQTAVLQVSASETLKCSRKTYGRKSNNTWLIMARLVACRTQSRD